jgi:phosphatidylserine synthase 2
MNLQSVPPAHSHVPPPPPRPLQHLHPSLGTPVADRTYAADCRLLLPGGVINWATLRATVVDEFVLAHALGWFAKALVLRNHLLLWSASVGFELLELSFRHMLPNFNECWWDSWLLDVAICNQLGGWHGLLRSVRLLSVVCCCGVLLLVV